MLYLIFKLYPFTLLRQCRSFTFLFMYLGELLQYYQSSNKLPQSAQTLDFDLKSCFILLNTSSRSNLCCFGLLRTSSRSARCRLVSTVETVCFNLSCFLLKPQLALLAVQLSLVAIQLSLVAI